MGYARGMKMQDAIESKLLKALEPAQLEVVNESHGHSVPKNSETHFKVFVVSQKFAGLSLVARHRLVYDVLKAEMSGGVHALALHTRTPEEEGMPPDSPPCLGGSKRG